MEIVLKIIFFRFLKTFAPLLKEINKHKLLVIYYHHVLPRHDMNRISDKNMCIEVKAFETQMKFLSENFVPLSETQIIESIDHKRKLPEHAVWVTFDDGYGDNHAYALPILKRYQIPATFFITSGYINQTACLAKETHSDVEHLFMTWAQIKELNLQGFGVGCHTVNHRILSSLVPNEIVYEIESSKMEIEKEIGRPVITFAYPHGKRIDCVFKKAIPMLRQCGIRMAVTTVGGMNSLRDFERNSLRLRRLGISHDDSLTTFKTKVESGCFWQK